MTPISLTIKGLLSYGAEPQTIDFTTLTKKGLFGIFGKVGSGKTAIIDALTLALYGVSERLRASGDASADIINFAAEGFAVEFVLRTEGNEAGVYKFVAEGEKVGEQLLVRRSCYRFAGEDTWEHLPNASAKTVLGMEYTHFKRTVLLPQAQFSEFLHLSGNDRAAMLVDLFDIRRFDLYPLIKQKRQVFKDRLRAAKERLAKLSYAVPETLLHKERDILTLDKDIQSAEKFVREASAKTERYAAYSDIFDSIKEQQEYLQSLNEQMSQITKREEQLHRYRLCVDHFQPDVREKDRIREQVAKLEFELGKAQKMYNDMLNSAKKEAKLEHSSLTTLRDLHGTAQELHFILKLKRTEEDIEKCTAAMYNARIEAERATAFFENSHTEVATLNEQIAATEAEMPSAAELSDVARWFSKKNELLQVVAETNEQKEQLLQKIEQKEQKITKYLQPFVPEEGEQASLFEDINPISTQLLEKHIEEAKSSLEHLFNEREDAKVHLRLHEFLKHLEDGKPCPLCGSLEHPGIQLEQHPADNMKQVQMKIVAQQQNINTLEQIRRQCDTALAELASLQEQLLQLEQKANEANLLLDEHTAVFAFEGFSPDDEKHVLTVIRNEQSIKDKLRSLRRNKEKLEQQLRNSLQMQERSAATLTAAATDRYNLQMRRSRIRQVFSYVRPSDFEFMTLDEVAAIRQETLQKIEEQERLYHTAEDHSKRLEFELVQTEMFIRDQTNAINDLQEISIEIQERLSAGMKQHGIDSIEEVLSKSVNIGDEERYLGAFYADLDAAKRRLDELNGLVAMLDCDQDSFIALKSKMEEARLRLPELYHERARLLQECEKLNQDLHEREELEEEKLIAEEHLQVFSRLNDTFAHSKFLKYICNSILEKLCNNANERFRHFSRGRLELVVLPDNAIGVRDPEGGSIRSVHTLSGGQTFQAALALALALAETLQISAGKQKFFFLDEGLGVLDTEAAEQVFSALADLAKQGITVGFVAHLESLQEKVPAALVVHRNPGESSIITMRETAA